METTSEETKQMIDTHLAAVTRDYIIQPRLGMYSETFLRLNFEALESSFLVSFR